MATSINYGNDFRVWNFSVGATSDTQIILNKEVNAVIIKCRTAVDLYLKRGAGDTYYFTIASGTIFTLPMSTPNLEPFALKSGSGTVDVEIIGVY